MRRLFVLLAGVCLTHTVGCYHVAGKCDCAPPVQPCCIYGLYPPAAGWPVLPAMPPQPQAGGATPVGNEIPAVEVTPANPPLKEQIGLPREL
jgi:hypothetical protein